MNLNIWCFKYSLISQEYEGKSSLSEKGRGMKQSSQYAKNFLDQFHKSVRETNYYKSKICRKYTTSWKLI